MIKIGHIALYTQDLERSTNFYTNYFNGEAGTPYHNPTRGFRSRFIRFGSDVTLEIMTLDNGLQLARDDIPAVGYAHMAFSVGGKDAVDGLTARLEQDGYTVASRPRVTGDGYYESCVLDPDGNRVEMVADDQHCVDQCIY